MRHIYKIEFLDDTMQQIEGKTKLTELLKIIDLKTVKKVLWYKSNGFWNDVTRQYIKQ